MSDKLKKLQELIDKKNPLNKIMEGVQVMKGDKGDSIQGEPGYTPVIYKDYFTSKQIDDIASFIEKSVQSKIRVPKDGEPGKPGKDAINPERGLDYWTPKDREQIIKDVLKDIKVPQDGVSPKMEDIASLVVKELKNKPISSDIVTESKLIDFLRKGGFRGGGISDSPVDGKQYARKDGQWVEITATGGVSKIIAGTNITISPTNGLGDVTINSTASGSGDVVGPASAVDSNFAVFDTTTGKLIKDSGKKASDFQVAGTYATGTGSASGTNTGDNAVNSLYSGLATSKVDANGAIIGATKTKITYDAKGLVTAGADATTADIADSLNKRYVTDANLTVIGNTSGTNSGDNATNSQYSGLAMSKQDALNGTGFIKATGTTISYDNSTYVPTSRTVAGKALSTDITLALDDLSDVIIASPQLDEIIKYNGSAFINGPQTSVNGGSGVDFFPNETASDIATYKTLSKVPASTAELDETVVVNNNKVLLATYASALTGLGGTQIDAGVWNFDIWGYVSSTVAGVSTIIFDIYKRTNGGTETLLFSISSNTLTTTIALSSITSVQQAFTINATDRLVLKVSGNTTATANRTVHFVHNGTIHYSHLNTPLVIRHNDLAGLQGGTGGQYNHLTDAQLVVVGNTSGTNTGDSATNTTSNSYADGKVEDSIVDGHTTIAPSGNAVFDALALKAPLTSPTFATSINGSYLTASQLLGTDASKNIVSLPVVTYPSLTELSYVKGVTSGIQSQINAKGAGTVTSVSVATANGVSGSSSGGATPALTIALGAITPTSTNGVSATTMAYLDATSSIQTQINTKANKDGSNWTITSQAIGDLTYATSTTAYGRLASVAAGSYLRSGGVGTAPVWSTPTLPNTANTNHLMVGNGTNWVESTPEFPNASATSGKIIKSDGTNWVASTETYAVPGTSGNVLTSDGTNWTSVAGVTASSTTTFTNKRINPRLVTAASYTTDTGTSLDVSTCDQFEITAQAGALLFNAPGGTPVGGNKLIIRIKDNGTARALTWNAIFRASSDLVLPTTTILSKTLYMGFTYNATDTKWDLLAVLNNF